MWVQDPDSFFMSQQKNPSKILSSLPNSKYNLESIRSDDGRQNQVTGW